jgi:hypothetical protein
MFMGSDERDGLQDQSTYETGTPASDYDAAAYVREHPKIIQQAVNSCLE